MADWYYADADNNRHGPLPARELAALHARGALRPEFLVWREGMPAWAPWRDHQHEVIERVAAPPPIPPESSAAESPYAPPRSALSDDGGVVAGGHVVYAGFWKRVAASIIDSFVTSFAAWALLIPMFMVMGVGLTGLNGVQDGSGGNVLLTVLYYVITLLLPLFYLSFMHSSASQATFGKMAVGIKVTRTNGERIGFWRAFGRYFAYILSSMLLFIGLIMAGVTERKQALHDMMCDTLVVDKHAFTAHPERQRDELGSVAVAVLVLFGLMFVGMFVLIAIGIAALAAGGLR
jgi:uncharacterized RDD family membrane protein YckC